MLSALLEKIGSTLNDTIIQSNEIAGGDINRAFKIVTTQNVYFAKLNDLPHSEQMFQAEAEALRVIKAHTKIAPEPVAIVSAQGQACLILNFIHKVRTDLNGFIKVGQSLASLHKISHEKHGWHMDNYIGAIHQNNDWNACWAEFYYLNRIQKLIRQAYEKKLITTTDLKQSEKLFSLFYNHFPEEKSSFLHGDLWNGNLISDTEGNPWLIDPASYFGHREMDIAMTYLFGGFPDQFYQAYQDEFPLLPEHNERMSYYQLYYLLIHLILFGSSYYSKVRRILKTL